MMKQTQKQKVVFITKLFLIFCTLFFHPDIFFEPDISAYADTARTVKNLSIDPEFQPQPGTYHYKVAWNKINVGDARISVFQEGDQYKIEVHAETGKKLDRIYKIRYRGESRISDNPIAPIETKIHERVKSTKKDTVIEFQENGIIKSTETKTKKGKPTKETEREIQTDNFTLDPFSATFLVRRLDWEAGMEEIFDVYTGDDQYLLELKCIQKKTIEIAGKKRQAWEIVPALTNRDEKEQAKEDKQMNDMWIYVSADETKEMLKIKVALKIGSFRIVLEKFEPTVVQQSQ